MKNFFCFLIVLFSTLSYSEADEKNIGYHLFISGKPYLAERFFSNDSKGRLLNYSYFNLLVSGAYGKLDLEKAREVYNDNFKEHPVFSDELKSVLLYLDGRKKEAVEILRKKDFIINSYARYILAQEYYYGEILPQDFERSYDIISSHRHDIYEAPFLLSRLAFEKRLRKNERADAAIKYLISSFRIGLNNQNSEEPTLLLIHLTQDGVIMPKNDILSAAIALSSPSKTDRIANAFMKVSRDFTIEDFYNSYELSNKITYEINKAKYDQSDSFLYSYVLGLLYKERKGGFSGLVLDFPAYDFEEVLMSYY